MILVEQLAATTTEELELAEIISFWQDMGIDTTAWGPGDFERAFAELWAFMAAKMQNTLVRATIQNFYVEHATGIALTYLADSAFDLARIQAVATQGDLTLTDDTGDGPHNITTAMFAVGDDGSLYQVITADTLPQSGTVTVTIECSVPGTIGNVGNATIIQLQSPIAGVSVTNGISGGDSWITRVGSNYEKDTILRQRCRTKFATYSPNSPVSAYENLVLSATDGGGDPVGLAKVWIDADNPGGPGTVYIYIANQTATATSQQVTDVQAFIDDDRVSPAAIPTVIAATEVTVDIYGDLYVTAGFAVSALAAVTAAHESYLVGTDVDEDDNIGLPLGGKQLDTSPGGAGFVLFSDLIELAKAVDGVRDLQLSSPGGNQALAGNELATVGTIQFNVIEI